MNIEMNFSMLNPSLKVTSITLGNKVLTWDTTETLQKCIRGKGVYIDDEYGNERICELLYQKITSITLEPFEEGEEIRIDNCKDYAKEFVLNRIVITDNQQQYELPDICYGWFKSKEIITENMSLSIACAQFEEMKKYFRESFVKDQFIDALNNNDSIPKNVISYLLSTDICNDAAATFDEYCLNSISGEEEYDYLHAIMNEYNIKLYCLVSNKGTENECVNKVLMSPSDIEKLDEIMREREYYVPEIYGEHIDQENVVDEDGDAIDYFYVDDYYLPNVCSR